MARVKQTSSTTKATKLTKSKGGAVVRRFAPNRVKKDGTPALAPRARNGRGAIREIRRYQGSVSRSAKAPKGKNEATMLLIAKSAIRKDVKKIIADNKDDARIQGGALKALHVAAEDFLTDIMTDVAWLTSYCRRSEARGTDVAVADWIATTKPKERNALTFPVQMPRPFSDRSGQPLVVAPKVAKKASDRRAHPQESKVVSPSKKLTSLAGKVQSSLKDKKKKLQKKLQKRIADEFVGVPSANATAGPPETEEFADEVEVEVETDELAVTV